MKVNALVWCSILAQLTFQSQLPILASSISDKDAVVSLHKELVSIESLSTNEHEVASWLSDYLKSKNFSVELQFISKSRANVIANPSGVTPTILLTSHIDTVPPFIPYFRNSSGFIGGRGTVDAKACVAAQTIAALRVLEADPSSPIGLLYVVGEEIDGDGMQYFASHAAQNYSAVVFGEPTEGKLASAHKGVLGFHIGVTGKAAHSGYPWLGLSANNMLLKILNLLLEIEPHLPRSEPLGPSTLNIGRLSGGEAANVVAAHATAEVFIRLGGGTPEKARNQIAEALNPIKKEIEDKGGELHLDWKSTSYGPVFIDTDIPGFEIEGMNYGTDIPNYPGNHKKYLWGPGSILVAHGANEGLWEDELVGAVDTYEKIVNYLLEA